MQRDVTVGVNQARQDELAGRIDDVVVGGFRPYGARDPTDMADPISLNNHERISNRVAPRSIDQCSVLDQ